MRDLVAMSGAVLAGLLWAGSATAGGRPVVVELFTSEGCSSCPPADALLTDLAQRRADVLPLAFHVTYWNGLGWRDPYSLEAATARQAAYGARFGDGSYTPETVVDGAVGVVGSDRGRVGEAIETALAARRAAPPLSLWRKGGAVSLQVGAGTGRGRILLVGFDPVHQTAVGRGENRGRTLTESNIVRGFAEVGRWDGAPVSLHVAAPAGQDLAVLIEADDGRMLGAARAGEGP